MNTVSMLSIKQKILMEGYHTGLFNVDELSTMSRLLLDGQITPLQLEEELGIPGRTARYWRLIAENGGTPRSRSGRPQRIDDLGAAELQRLLKRARKDNEAKSEAEFEALELIIAMDTATRTGGTGMVRAPSISTMRATKKRLGLSQRKTQRQTRVRKLNGLDIRNHVTEYLALQSFVKDVHPCLHIS